MTFNTWMSRAFRLVSVCVSASLGTAFAQNTQVLTQADPHGYVWDAGGSQWGTRDLQLYPPFAGNGAQAFTWTPVANGWTVCSTAVNICLSDDGSGLVVMSGKADTFTISNQGAVLDVTTGKYIEESATVANGAFLVTGSIPFTWSFAFFGGQAPPPPQPVNNSGSLTIMPMGDSITEGSVTASTYAQGGYRCPLYSSLQNTGLQFAFVGDSASLEPGVVTACPAVNWEGHAGYDIAAIQGWADADGSIRNLQPNIILLLAGTNDVGQYETGSVSTQLSSLLNDIFNQDPNAWVIVSTIPPINPSAPYALPQEVLWAPNVTLANAEIATTVANYKQTTLIDFYSAVVSNVNAYIGSDGVHPTVLGYGVLANLWSNSINTYVKASNAAKASSANLTKSNTRAH
jgi:lysophospholipase L1-like esterase